MKLVRLGLVAVLLLGSPPAVAQTISGKSSPTRCKALSDQITDTVKEMAVITEAGGFEDSTLRATTRAAELANMIAENQTRVLLMQAGGCPPYEGPVSASAFRPAVRACRDAKTAQSNIAFIESEQRRLGRLPTLSSGRDAATVLAEAKASLPPEVACDSSKWVATE